MYIKEIGLMIWHKGKENIYILEVLNMRISKALVVMMTMVRVRL